MQDYFPYLFVSIMNFEIFILQKIRENLPHSLFGLLTVIT